MNGELTLTPSEEIELAECESGIDRSYECGLQAYAEMGAFLLRIRYKRLYRAKYGTFDNYCQKRWKLRRRQVDRFIDAVQIVGNLSPVGLIPRTERQVRELSSLPPEDQQTAWNTAVEQSANGQPTAAEVKEIVRQMKLPPTQAEIDANRRAREAERKLKETLEDRHAEHVRRFSVYRQLIESTEFIASFYVESIADAWDGITNARGLHFVEDLRKALAFLTRLEREHPNAVKHPGLVIERLRKDSAS